jgi:electron transfer flavoprotein alpha subunit
MPAIFSYIVHKGGIVDDSATELLAAARQIDPAVPVTAIIMGAGPELETVCRAVRSFYPVVWTMASDALAYPNAELIRKALVNVLPPGGVVLIPHAHFGIDLAPGLSIKLNAAYLSDVVAIDGREGAFLKVVRQEFGGQLHAHVKCDLSSGAVITVRPGAFKPVEAAAAGVVVDKSADIGPLSAGRRYLQTIVAEAGDVDITKYAVLVSIGRGIQEKENVPIAEELAEAMGAAVSCSRPVVDAKWLEKSRQVGSSGKTVKPKVYIACGISGSSQHLAGVKGKPFIIAINKNRKAPIFQVADVGIVDDILEFLPETTSKVRELHGAAAK